MTLQYPTTKIVYSWIYNMNLNPELNRDEIDVLYKEVLSIGREFALVYDKYIISILISIPKFSGYSWQECAEQFIPIYLVKGSKTSFSKPLTLKVRDDVIKMLVILIHELCHNNMDWKWENTVYMENCMNLVTQAVMHDIGLDGDQQYEEIVSFTKGRFQDRYKLLDLDVTKTTVKEWMNSSSFDYRNK